MVSHNIYFFPMRKKKISVFVCLFVLRFYGPVNPMHNFTGQA